MDRDPQARQDPLSGPSAAEAEAFVRANTRLTSPSLVPELKLHLADEALPLWHKTEEELSQEGLPPPFWAFAWAGGQALARHLLDEPSLARGRAVLDVGSGGGVVAIAAALCGASRMVANEVDPFAHAALAMNAAANAIAVELEPEDLLGTDPEGFELVLAGDLFYERPLAERALAFLRRTRAKGARVLIGDPGRSYLPRQSLVALGVYQVAVPRALEDADVKRTTVWTLS